MPETRLTEFPALSIDPRFGVSRSAPAAGKSPPPPTNIYYVIRNFSTIRNLQLPQILQKVCAKTEGLIKIASAT